MYRYRYINFHSQYGRTCCTLILQDLEGNMPTVRIDKEFGMPFNKIDEEMLFQQASVEIQVAQQAWNDQQAALAAQAAADAAANGDQ